MRWLDVRMVWVLMGMTVVPVLWSLLPERVQVALLDGLPGALMGLGTAVVLGGFMWWWGLGEDEPLADVVLQEQALLSTKEGA